MITRTVNCDRCGQPATQSFGEVGRGWFESFRCSACGNAYEADGGSPAPEEFRRAIIAEEGEWILEMIAEPTVSLLKALREQLSLSLRKVHELKERMPAEVRRGTRHEVNTLLRALEKSAAVSPG